MYRYLFCAVFAAAIHSSCFAILPPLWEGTAEIKAIFDDKQFGELLHSGEMIKEIKKTPSGWTIITNKTELQVTVEYLPASQPGPARFRFQFKLG